MIKIFFTGEIEIFATMKGMDCDYNNKVYKNDFLHKTTLLDKIHGKYYILAQGIEEINKLNDGYNICIFDRKDNSTSVCS